MNYQPAQWLKIALANAFGLDKLNFDDRIKYAEDSLGEGVVNAEDAEEPVYARAILDGLKGNDRVRVHLDATASGTQILAAFANCGRSGKHCNLFGKERQDAYTNGWKALGMTNDISRADFKAAFMTFQFGSRKVPRETLGEENMPAFFDMYREQFPGVWGVLQFIQSLWQPDVHSHRWTMPDGFEVIQLNTGFDEETVKLFGQDVVVFKQVRTRERRGIALAANITHSTDGFICREMIKRAQFDPEDAHNHIAFGFPLEEAQINLDALVQLYRKTRFLSVDLINCMNSQTFHEVLNEMERLEIHMLLEHLASKEQFYMVPIHDSFSCEARYCNDMCATYQYLMQQLWDSSVLESIAQDITGENHTSKKYPTILDGIHMIC